MNAKRRWINEIVKKLICVIVIALMIVPAISFDLYIYAIDLENTASIEKQKNGINSINNVDDVNSKQQEGNNALEDDVNTGANVTLNNVQDVTLNNIQNAE